MKEIQLNAGMAAIIDDDDFDAVSQFKWYWGFKGYVGSPIKNGKKRTTVYLARLVMNAPSGAMVDHVNHNTLDNRKENLRLVSSGQNQANRIIDKNRKIKTSKYKGVNWHKFSRKWHAQIAGRYIGLFESETDAARAYNLAALERFGQYAFLNPV